MLSLVISPKESILTNLELNEPVDKIILEKLIISNLIKRDDEWDEKAQLTKYNELVDRETGNVTVEYIKSKSNPYGRVSAKGGLGLHMIRKEIRHTLAKNRFIDIDVVNCHPEMLYQICEYNKIECELLKDYVLNREKYLKMIMDNYSVSRDKSKELFIRILYGGSFEKWKTDNKINKDKIAIIDKFQNEFQKISNIILEKNQELTEIIILNKEKKNNLSGSVCSYFLQEYEYRVLTEIVNYCLDNKYIRNNTCVLCYDGIMLEKHLYKEELLIEFNQLIKQKIGFDLKFLVKEMDCDYLSIMDHHMNYSAIYEYEKFEIHIPAYFFKYKYNKKFLFNDNNLYYYTGVYWKKDDKNDEYLNKFIDEKLYKDFSTQISNDLTHISKLIFIEKDELKLIHYNNKKNRILSIINNKEKILNFQFKEKMIKKIKVNITNNSILFDTDPFLFAFENKIFDLKNNKFIEPVYNQYIKTTTGYAYYKDYTSNKKNELNNIISNIFPDLEVKKYYMTILSTGLYGGLLENCFIATGVGANGKSLLHSLMLGMVGNYGFKLQSSMLLQEMKQGACPEIANLDCKRFVLVQEPDHKKTICSATLKEITGDKVLNIRQLYSNKTSISLNLSLFMECNNLPQIDEVTPAISRRLRVIPFLSEFVTQREYDNLIDKTNVFIKKTEYKGDLFEKEYRTILFDILTEYFQLYLNNNLNIPNEPKICYKEATTYLANNDNIYDWFISEYEYTDDDNIEPIKVKDIFDNYKYSNYYINMPKIEKKKYNLKLFNESFKKNIFLRKYYLPRDKTYNKKKYKSPVIINYKIKMDDYMIQSDSDNNENFIIKRDDSDDAATDIM